MSDSQFTRFVRLRADADRNEAPNDRTVALRTGQFASLVLPDHRDLFNQHQKRMHAIAREYEKPGVVVFALHALKGIAGHLWLEASAQVRSGTIGRHSKVDLFLADDDALSLRHLLVLVKRDEKGLWLRVADLVTPAGFQAEEGGPIRALEANGTLVLRAASYSLIVVPTGEAPPWDAEAKDPWATLPPRVLVSEPRPERLTPVPVPEARRRERETSLSFHEGPREPGPELALEVGERVEGHLVIGNDGHEDRLAVGEKALSRGIILGRYSRCAGNVDAMPEFVSRVHAVLMSVDGVVHLIDAGSTHGINVEERDVKCVPIGEGVNYAFASTLIRWERAQ